LGNRQVESFSRRPAPDRSGAVDLAAARDAGDQHDAIIVVDRVDDPVVADSDAEVVTAGELDRPDRAWIARKTVDGGAGFARAAVRAGGRAPVEVGLEASWKRQTSAVRNRRTALNPGSAARGQSGIGRRGRQRTADL
jgi:hypothetical protein